MNISGVGLITFDELKGYANPAKDEGTLSEQSRKKDDKETIVSAYKEGDVLIMTPKMRSHLLGTIESKFKYRWLSEGVLLLEHRIG